MVRVIDKVRDVCFATDVEESALLFVLAYMAVVVGLACPAWFWTAAVGGRKVFSFELGGGAKNRRWCLSYLSSLECGDGEGEYCGGIAEGIRGGYADVLQGYGLLLNNGVTNPEHLKVGDNEVTYPGPKAAVGDLAKYVVADEAEEE